MGVNDTESRYNKRWGNCTATDRRRQLVASLMVRNPRISRRQITEVLARPEREGGMRNPTTKKPWSLATIQKDVQFILEEWREARLASADEWIAQELATYEELQIQAWRNNDLAEVRRVSVERRKLLGLDAPTKIAPTDPTGKVSFGPGFLSITEYVENADQGTDD
jgi:membrane peptidoglycan carboxypeptidase